MQRVYQIIGAMVRVKGIRWYILAHGSKPDTFVCEQAWGDEVREFHFEEFDENSVI